GPGALACRSRSRRARRGSAGRDASRRQETTVFARVPVGWRRGAGGVPFAQKETRMTTTRRHPHVVNIEEVKPREESRGNFVRQSRRIGTEAGGRALGCSHFELAPGKTA